MNNKVRKVSSESHEAVRLFVSAARPISGDVLWVDGELSTWTDETLVDFITAALDDAGNIIESTRVVWKGQVDKSNNFITNIERVGGNEDLGNNIGDIVETVPTHAWANDLADVVADVVEAITPVTGDFSIPISAWQNTVPISATITIPEIRAESVVIINTTPQSANDAVGIYPNGVIGDGFITLYASAIPTAELFLKYTIISGGSE
jgi:hypothetical protein